MPPLRQPVFGDLLRRWLANLTGRATLRVRGETIRPIFFVTGRLEARKICALDSEEEPLARVLGELRPGDVVYDIGANLGLYAVPCAMKLAALGPGPDGVTGHVIAFEPVSEWAARLRQNARGNRLGNLDVFEVALSNANGRAELTMKPVIGSGMGSLVKDYAAYFPAESSRRIEVEVNRADEYVARHGLPAPTVLKIDVEGSELAVLDGLGPLLANPNCRFALIEVHQRFSTNDGAVPALLAARGFHVERGPDRGSEYHLFASRSVEHVMRRTTSLVTDDASTESHRVSISGGNRRSSS